MRSMGGCSKAEKNGSSIRKMAFLRKIPLCHHDSRKYRGCDADLVTIIALRRCNIPTLYPQREHTPPAAGCTAVFRAQKGKILCLL